MKLELNIYLSIWVLELEIVALDYVQSVNHLFCLVSDEMLFIFFRSFHS